MITSRCRRISPRQIPPVHLVFIIYQRHDAHLVLEARRLHASSTFHPFHPFHSSESLQILRKRPKEFSPGSWLAKALSEWAPEDLGNLRFVFEPISSRRYPPEVSSATHRAFLNVNREVILAVALGVARPTTDLESAVFYSIELNTGYCSLPFIWACRKVPTWGALPCNGGIAC